MRLKVPIFGLRRPTREAESTVTTNSGMATTAAHRRSYRNQAPARTSVLVLPAPIVPAATMAEGPRKSAKNCLLLMVRTASAAHLGPAAESQRCDADAIT